MRLSTWAGVCLMASLGLAAWAGDEDWRKRKAPAEDPGKFPVSDQPLRHVTEMTFEMPTTFIPASAPRQPLDPDLRVGLILPLEDESSKSSWFYWAGQKPGEAPVYLLVDHASPVAAVLPAVLARLFPRVDILDKARAMSQASKYDLLLEARVQARNLATEGTFGGVTVTGTLTVSRADGSPLTVIQGVLARGTSRNSTSGTRSSAQNALA